jgi:hypothetical protein
MWCLRWRRQHLRYVQHRVIADILCFSPFNLVCLPIKHSLQLTTWLGQYLVLFAGDSMIGPILDTGDSSLGTAAWVIIVSMLGILGRTLALPHACSWWNTHPPLAGHTDAATHGEYLYIVCAPTAFNSPFTHAALCVQGLVVAAMVIFVCLAGGWYCRKVGTH